MRTVEDPTAHQAGPPRTGALPLWLCPLIGVGSAAFGLLPWLVSGLRLAMQNLWATDTAPHRMPLVLLPFSQYAIVLLIVVIVLGAATAGLCARALRPRLPRGGVAAVAVSVLVLQVLALLQTATAVRAGLARRVEADLYLAALVAVAMVAIVVGALVMGLVAVGPGAAAVVGLSVAALASGPWLGALAFEVTDPRSASSMTLQLLELARWAPPVLVGAAIAWGGLRTTGQVAAAAASLLLLWVVPPLTTGIQSAAGSRVLADEPLVMAHYALTVFKRALTMPELVVRPLIVALVVAAAGILGQRILGHHRSAGTPHG